MIKYLALKYYKIKIIRRLAMNIPSENLHSPIVRIFLEGYIEIFIALIISMAAFSQHNYLKTSL
jgi:hypothetical protein